MNRYSVYIDGHYVGMVLAKNKNMAIVHGLKEFDGLGYHGIVRVLKHTVADHLFILRSSNRGTK
jgi:hypothetical protein